MFRKKHFNINIGTVIFGALFLYLIITVVLYLTAEHISSYQVTSGPLSQNETYTALALRSEEVVDATAGGYVSYYLGDSSKISQGGAVCGIGSTQNLLENKTLTASDLQTLQEAASNFSQSYDGGDFSSVYDFKYTLDGKILSTEDPSSLSGTLVTSDSDGVVAYSCDGYETLTQEDITPEIFSEKSYRRTNLRTEEQISAGDPLYRLIRSETWSIVIPVTDRQTVRLASHDTIQVKFLKDGQSETGQLSLFVSGDQRYVQITFTSGMIRYCNDRFLDVELVTNTRSGLKIPISAIVTKEFYTIPSSFQTVSGENSEVGFLKEITDENGETTTTFVASTLYEEVTDEDTGESVYYVDMNDFQEGDVLIQPDSNARYTVGATGTLEGVYCINRGYAVFRKIVIIDQNEEFCIVESGTSYGIAQYDYIVEDGTQVNENEILY
ncbi:MAG TPA: hypothetical protein IAB52_00705 [Candidatus Scatomonas merdavium]|nr:hypothetical protein [Candidatus Scatomonas merdavium]